MDNYKTAQYFGELLLKFRDGTISDEELRRFKEELYTNPQARKYYVESAIAHSLFQGRKSVRLEESFARGRTDWDQDFWGELAAYEKTAPEVELPEEEPSRELIQKVVYPPRQQRKISRFGIFILAMNAAAIVFFIVFLRVVPPKGGVEVATLSDSINAKWADIDASMKEGARLFADNDKLMLREGIVELLFDNDTKVIIEAPAEFQILADDRIDLAYGKAYTAVSPDAIGFSIYTPNTRVIDIGTEFGVQAEVNGDMQLHVVKGKTMLIAGKNAHKTNIEVGESDAKQISGTTGEISDIGYRSDYFVRDINSEANLVWKGQKAIDLADILDGGNGFGNPHASVPKNKKTAFNRPVFLETPELEPGSYFAVEENPFIDGLFVPNGVNGPVSVSHDGQFLWDAPVMEVRQKIGYLRFDISRVQGERRGATLALGVRRWAGKKGQIQVYGLKDGPADQWDEARVTYNTAEGLLPAPMGEFRLHQRVLENLGTISLNSVGTQRSDTLNLHLDEFISQDTNGLLTFILVRQQNDLSAEWIIRTKEDTTGNPPTLTFPYGKNNGPVEITTVVANGADTYLSNDNYDDSAGPDNSHGTETALKIRNYIKNSCKVTNAGYLQSDELTAHFPFMLDGKKYTAQVNPILAMRANSAVTFDLQKIRSCYSGLFSLKSFSAVCGPTEVSREYIDAHQWRERPKAGVYVLIDGQERFSKTDMTAGDASCPITVELTPQDRYLTLITTGGTERKAPRDWGLFVSPRINIE